MATKGRSPNYPSISLGDALERARQIYEAEHTNPAPRIAIAKDLGYTLNGASQQLIGSLTRYGILEKADGDLRLSKDVVDVMELPPGDSRRAETIERLALTPKLFSELKERFPDGLPSEETLRHHLITSKDFLPKAAGEVIRVYHDTVNLVSQEKSACNAETNADEGSESVIPEPVTSTLATRREVPVAYTLVKDEPQREPSMNVEAGQSLQFPLSENSEVRILFSGPIAREDIDKVKSHLDLTRDAFPLRAQLNTPLPHTHPDPTPDTPEEEQ